MKYKLWLPTLYEDHIAFANNRIVDFHYSDSKELFNYNLEIQPPEWRYRESSGMLSYTFDKHGFRNINDLEAISESPYVAAVGCSHTMGTGQYYEETYPYLVQKLFNMPVYNMGLAASSNEVSALNITWLLNNYNPPHTLIYQKTIPSRLPIFAINDEGDNNNLIFAGPWIGEYGNQYLDIEQMLVISDHYRYNELKDIMSELHIRQQCKRLGINLVVIDVEEELKKYDIVPDLSRDFVHYGYNFNLHLANVILSIVEWQ